MWIKDKEFIRGNCPMTKEEARILAVAKMNLDENSRVLDIGTGTGTIAIQSAFIAKNAMVYTVERDKDAIDTAKANINKFNPKNLELIEDEALNFLKEFKEKIQQGKEEKFDSVFIGGSGGDLEDIIEITTDILKDNGTLVLNMITLGNAQKAIEKMENLEFSLDISHINVSKVKGKIMMFMANNPIFIIKGEKK